MEQESVNLVQGAEQPQGDKSLTEQQREDLKKQLTEGVQALGAEDQAHAKRLGEVAQGHDVHIDEQGVVMTQQEYQEALSHK